MPKKKSPASQPFQVEWLPLNEVTPYSNNTKEHPSHQIQQIADSIREFGFNDPIAVDETGTIIEGHGRYLAAQRLELETVPVIQIKHLTDAQRKAYILAHNKLCLNTGWDLDMLRVEFEALQGELNDLTITGFGDAEIDMLFAEPSIPDTEPELDEGILGEKEHTPKQVTCPQCGEEFHV